MRKFLSLLLLMAVTMVSWTSAYAQTDAEYEAALAAIEDGANYRISTDVNDTKYYLTIDGYLTNTKSGGGVFTLTKTSGEFKPWGFFIYGYTYFSNPPGTDDSFLLNGHLNTSDYGRGSWDAQVLFRGENGKYAVRSTNAAAGADGWNYIGGAYWTVDNANAPVAQYSFDVNYIWNFEKVGATITVTYQLYDTDGMTMISSVSAIQEAYSEISIPASLTSKFFYNYEAIGTIGDTDCIIKVIRTMKSGVVHSSSDLSNEKAYLIGCDRGIFLTKDGYLVSTALRTLSNANPTNFAIISYRGGFYLYSIADKKFVTNSGALETEPIHGVYDAIHLVPETNPYFLLYFQVNESTQHVLNTNGYDPYGCVINDWMTLDEGNQYYMVEEAEFDPTEAIAALDAYFISYVSYVVKDTEGNTVFTSEPVPTMRGTKITSLPMEYQRSFYTYNEIDVTINTDAVIEFTATWTGPFEISADFATAHWYDMAMRGTWYVTSAVKDDDGAYLTQNANTIGLVEDSYQWAFIGNGYDGFKIINKAEGVGYSLGYTDDAKTNQGIPTMMLDNEGNHIWKVVASTNTSVPAGSFCLNVPGTNLYINQYGGAGGSVKFWNSTLNISDPGSAFTVFDVPTNFASFVVDEIAPELEATGYFAFTDAAKATFGWNPAYTTECPFDVYKSLKENLDAVKKDITNFILPETGYYTLKSKMYGTYMGIDPNDANMYGNYATATTAKQIVKLIKNEDNTYTIGLMGKFAPAEVAQSEQVSASTESGTYTVYIPSAGYASFQANTENEYSALHCDNYGSIVGWKVSEEASQWTVTNATSIQLSVGEAGYATAYLPFPVVAEDTDLKVYTARLTGSYLTLDELQGTIPEATPVIFKAAPKTYVFTIVEKAEEVIPDGALGIYDDKVDGNNALVKGWAAPVEENILKGTFEPIDAAGKYVLAKPQGMDVCFYMADSGTISACKAYLDLDSDVKAFTFKFADEDPTSIVNFENVIKNGFIYNIAGQRVNKMQKGINIVGGKKVMK